MNAFAKVLAAIFLLNGPLLASPAGSIHGIVRDASGGVVTRAILTITNSGSGEKRSTNPHTDGVFEFARLAPGSWSLAAEAAGFRRVTIPEVVVYVDQMTPLDVRMEVGERAETIEVKATTISVETDPTAKTIIGSQAIDSMPLNAHVAAPRPKTSPKIVCHRFCPRYGIPVGTPALRYFFDGEYIQMPMMMPMSDAPVPMPEDQMTTLLHSAPCFRNGVKYNQCGIAPT